jgi:hypothetical protein
MLAYRKIPILFFLRKGKFYFVFWKTFSFVWCYHSPSSYPRPLLFALNAFSADSFLQVSAFFYRSSNPAAGRVRRLPTISSLIFFVESSTSEDKNESRSFLRRHCVAAVVPTTISDLAHLVDIASTLCHHGWIQLSKCGSSNYQTWCNVSIQLSWVIYHKDVMILLIPILICLFQWLVKIPSSFVESAKFPKEKLDCPNSLWILC